MGLVFTSRADFVKMHLSQRWPVDLRLGLAQNREDAAGQFLLSGCEPALFDHIGNMVKMAMSMLRAGDPDARIGLASR